MRHWGVLKLPLTVVAAVSALILAACAPAGSAPQSPTASESTSASGSASPSEASPSPSPSDSSKPSKVLYLTFDDGPSVPFTRQILDIFEEYNSKTTFFIYGAFAKVNPGVVKDIVSRGQAIGNHTYNHPNLTTLSDDAVRKELSKTADVVGPGMGPCMRPPYLATNDRVRRISKQEGYSTVLGDLSAADWTVPPVSTLMASLRAASKNKAIIIIHDGPQLRQNTVAAVRQLMPWWIKKGFSLESLPQCVNPVQP